MQKSSAVLLRFRDADKVNDKRAAAPDVNGEDTCDDSADDAWEAEERDDSEEEADKAPKNAGEEDEGIATDGAEEDCDDSATDDKGTEE